MTSQKGDTAVYLLYSYIRVCSILRKSQISEEEIKATPFEFTDPSELIIARQIVKFVETIVFVADKMVMNGLCFYLYNLANKLSSNYNRYQINNNEKTAQRIKLIYATKLLMERCFYILGIETVDKI
jgi:arginyl-tRNA synthetase